jgi:hypothetical protein
VDRSAGQFEAFSGRADDEVLRYLAGRWRSDFIALMEPDVVNLLVLWHLEVNQIS